MHLQEKNFAFLEFRSVEEASNCMAFDGIAFRDCYLKVSLGSDPKVTDARDRLSHQCNVPVPWQVWGLLLARSAADLSQPAAVQRTAVLSATAGMSLGLAESVT
jgi:hypothetical protein